MLVLHKNQAGETRPAIVTRVRETSPRACVDLTVFAPGRFEHLEAVYEGDEPGCFQRA